MGQRSILVVEDEPLIAMMLEDFLESLGHSVTATCDIVSRRDGRGGQGRVRSRHPRRESERRERLAGGRAAARASGIPFVLATGGHVDPPPAQFANVPVIEKPYTVDRVTPALEAAFAEQ